MPLNKTAIEWTDFTWNPITGCLKGCEYCYAKKIATRFAGGSAFPKGFEPTFHPERLADHFPKKPSKIFTCSMGELFGDWLPEWQVQDVFATIHHYPQHTFQILTKQPQNLIKWSPFPDNVWVGVSATNFEQFAMGLMGLQDVKAGVKFFSFEPLLHEIAPDKKYAGYNSDLMAIDLKNTGIGWVIIGQKTPVRRCDPQPNPDWVRSIMTAANVYNIPVFVKDNIISDASMDLRLSEMRQGFPITGTK